MTDIHYTTSGDSQWIAMLNATLLLVVTRDAGAERLAALWASVGSDIDSRAVLDALTRGGISSTPDFVLIDLPEEFGTGPATVSIIARGSIKPVVMTASESFAVSAEGTSTWVERSVEDALTIRFGSEPDAGTTAASRIEFVLRGGSVPITWMEVGSAANHSGTELVAPALEVVPPDPGLTISSVPEEIQEPPLVESSPESGYDFFFGETVVRTVEDAAVRSQEEVIAPPPGDHDGHTAIALTAAERRAARAARHQGAAAPDEQAPHFVLEFSTGESEVLLGPVIVGRAPSASKVSANSVPRLITVEGTDQDISRNHIQLSLEGGSVMVTDLHSRNGTMVTLPGRAPQRLRGGAPTAVIDGAVIDLGSDITIKVCER